MHVNVTSLRGRVYAILTGVYGQEEIRTHTGPPPPRTSPRGRECIAHYGIMGYFDPPRITESTMRDSIRKSLGCCSFFPPSRSSFELTEPRALSGPQQRWIGSEMAQRKKKKKERRNEKEEERTRSAVAAREARSGETGTKERHEEFWLRKPRRQMRTSERGYEKSEKPASLLLQCSFQSPSSSSFSSCLSAERAPQDLEVQSSVRNVHLYALIVRIILPPSLFSFLPRDTRTRVSFRISSGISPFCANKEIIDCSTTVFSWMEIGIPLLLSKIQVVRNSKMAESSDKEE